MFSYIIQKYMKNYYCECCMYTTHIRTHYVKHLTTKKHKKCIQMYPVKKTEDIEENIDNPTENLIVDNFGDKNSDNLAIVKMENSDYVFLENSESYSLDPNKYICKYCKKEFKYSQGLSKHVRYNCKFNKDEDLKELARLMNIQMQKMDEKDKQIDKLHKQIEKLTSKLQITSYNNNGTINNITNNYKILNYNKTDYSHLTHKDYVRCIQDCNKCVQTLIERVHFNKDKPENMNVYISSIKGNYIMIYKDDQWQITDRKETLEDMYDHNEFHLETWYDEYKEKYPKIIKSFQRYLKNKEESDAINDVKNDILLMLYNKRKMVSTNHDVERIKNDA